MKNPYIVSVIGVCLMAIATVYGAIRAVMFRQMFQASTGAAGFAGRRGMNPFGFTNGLTIIALVVAIAGLVWLGLVIRKSYQSTAK